jgi:proteasome lid subunit RPN8/RPN11
MGKRWMFVLMLTAAAAVRAWAGGDEIFCDRGVVRQSWDLLAKARFGHGRQEEAAFVVRDVDGAMHFVVWPSTNETLRTHFTGRMPANTVAIVHTHPLDQPLPSPDDEALAQRLRIPVYVLTRQGVTRSGGRYLLLGDWNPKNVGPAPPPVTCRDAAAILAARTIPPDAPSPR